MFFTRLSWSCAVALFLPACGAHDAPRASHPVGAPAMPAAEPARCEVRDYGEGEGDGYSSILYLLNTAGRVVQTEEMGSASALTHTTHYELDSDGRAIRARTEVDAENGEPPPAPAYRASYQVDGASRRVVEHRRYDDDSTMDITWTFDEAGRPISRLMDGSQQLVSAAEREDGAEGQLESISSRFDCGYDAAGRLISERSHVGDAVSYEYEGDGRWPARVRRSGIDDDFTHTLEPIDGGMRVLVDFGDEVRGRVDYLGACSEIFFGEACSSVLAPTPPAGRPLRPPE